MTTKRVWNLAQFREYMERTGASEEQVMRSLEQPAPERPSLGCAEAGSIGCCDGGWGDDYDEDDPDDDGLDVASRPNLCPTGEHLAYFPCRGKPPFWQTVMIVALIIVAGFDVFINVVTLLSSR